MNFCSGSEQGGAYYYHAGISSCVKDAECGPLQKGANATRTFRYGQTQAKDITRRRSAHRLSEAAQRVLEPEFEVAGIASNGLELVEQAARLLPDAVVLDIWMPLLNGLEAARQIKGRSSGIKLLFATQRSGREYPRLAFQVGGSGYILKHSLGRELVPALREILAGRTYVTQALGGYIPAYDDLTARQWEVLKWLARGISIREIAAALNVSMKTIEFHRAALMEKLGLHSNLELVRYAVEHGIADRAG